MSKQNMEEEMGKIAESLDRMGLDGADNGTRSEQEPVAATLEQEQTVVSEKGPRDNCGNEEKTVRYVNRGPFGRRGAVHSVILKIFVHRDSEIDARGKTPLDHEWEGFCWIVKERKLREYKRKRLYWIMERKHCTRL
ncbi:hypothetical protein Tcan_16012 [Toxocara canis]|uniref:Uncharacterized protein n=1 Tax=Toxocara canis TaxID=6265 RepID=A0A0B2VZ11_TOXCA|nr:hypothetical protein Tcan_16012 [Toxocara canis]